MSFYFYLMLTIIFTALGQVFYKNYYITKKTFNLFLSIGFFILTPALSYLALSGLPPRCLLYVKFFNYYFKCIFLSGWFFKENLKKKEKFGNTYDCSWSFDIWYLIRCL